MSAHTKPHGARDITFEPCPTPDSRVQSIRSYDDIPQDLAALKGDAALRQAGHGGVPPKICAQRMCSVDQRLMEKEAPNAKALPVRKFGLGDRQDRLRVEIPNTDKRRTALFRNDHPHLSKARHAARHNAFAASLIDRRSTGVHHDHRAPRQASINGDCQPGRPAADDHEVRAFSRGQHFLGAPGEDNP